MRGTLSFFGLLATLALFTGCQSIQESQNLVPLPDNSPPQPYRDLVVRSGELTPQDAVLEVGTGTGSLTGRMSYDAGCVTSAEIDPGFARMARELLGKNPKVRLFEGDALQNKNTMDPELIAAWKENAANHGCTRFKLVANLPYSVAVPVMTNLLIDGPVPERMVGMVQWEIAERMTASPGVKEYASLAIICQALADVSIVRRIPPRSFFPPPKVDSAIVQVDSNPTKRALVDKLATPTVFGPPVAPIAMLARALRT